jgi:2'-hydroxyisoflavone reductase
MNILVLGGTRFLGRHLVSDALTRGYQVTLFNRGQSNPGLFPEVEKLRGDRAGDLGALKGRQWDAMIDTCGYVSREVRVTAALLAGSVEHYTFISSISVYAGFSHSGLDESAKLALLPHGTNEDAGDPATYGARKALCEESVEQIMPNRVLHIRPGLIIGPFDPTNRFNYWVRRVARGGEVLAPEHPDKPMQLIDARDLARWIITMIEAKQTGRFNATGPERPLTFGQMLDACKSASASDARFTWVDAQFLLNRGVAPFANLPLWLPESEKEYAGHFCIDSRRAFQSGLVCRPLVETVSDILLPDREHTPENTSVTSPPSGLTPGRERELLLAWMEKLK